MKFRIDLKILFFLVLFLFTHQLKIYLLIMIFAFLHEIVHLFTGVILGFKPTELEVMPFGFCISLKPKIEDYKKRILKSNIIELKYIFVAITGPLFNAILVFLFSKSNLYLAIYSNFLLCVINLIPIYPLDGGRILQSFFRIFMGKQFADKSMNIIANTSIIILTVVASIAILYFKNIAILLILAYLWEMVILENKRFKLKKEVF